ncbi:MAG: PIN domain nuclease [Clostridiales bacterium]|nr:PIN domain nuclease [Clostridiales bacterium]
MLNKIFRGILTLIGGVVGYALYLLTRFLLERSGNEFFGNLSSGKLALCVIVYVLIFAFIFFMIVPLLNRQSKKVAKSIESDLQNTSSGEVIMGTVGLLVGLLLAYLLSNVYSLIRLPYVPVILSVITYAITAYTGAIIGKRQGLALISNLNLSRISRQGAERKGKQNATPKILDTSVIIDGRILDIMETGFLEGPIVIPEFVLVELRHISDSSDSLKRNRGRRGLDVLNKIRDDYGVEIYDTNGDKSLEEIPEVDVKLLKLAQRMDGKVVTNDYNLNKVAGIKGVEVLNINELANALKPVVLPGEKMNLFLVKEGKNSGQALAYLDDGTMIVVEEGRKYIGKSTDVTVTSVLQTSAGRMIFAKPAH